MTRHFLGRSPGVRDVAYVLCNSIPRALREAKEREWLRRYRETLGAAGVTLTEDTALCVDGWTGWERPPP
jgi:hypothetical protein